MKGIFGNLFDLNRDGKLDSIERGMEFSFFNEIMKEEEKRRAREVSLFNIEDDEED